MLLHLSFTAVMASTVQEEAAHQGKLQEEEAAHQRRGQALRGRAK